MRGQMEIQNGPLLRNLSSFCRPEETLDKCLLSKAASTRLAKNVLTRYVPFPVLGLLLGHWKRLRNQNVGFQKQVNLQLVQLIALNLLLETNKFVEREKKKTTSTSAPLKLRKNIVGLFYLFSYFQRSHLKAASMRSNNSTYIYSEQQTQRERSARHGIYMR